MDVADKEKPAKGADLARLKQIERLLLEIRDADTKRYALLEEALDLVAGGESWNVTLKELSSYWDTLWCSRYAHGQVNRYVWTGARDFPQLKRMTKALTKQGIKDRMLNYIRNDDPFYVKARHSFAVFIASINSHAPKAAAPTEPETPWTAFAAALETEIGRHAFYSWFKSAEYLGTNGGVLRVQLVSRDAFEWVKRHYEDAVTKVCKQLDVEGVEFLCR